MINVTEILICMIVMFAPLLVYYYYVAYKKTVRISEKDILIDLCLLTILFLTISLMNYFDNHLYYFLVTIPILFSYLCRRYFMMIILSIVISSFLHMSIGLNIFYLILGNVLYYVAFYFHNKFNQHRDIFTTFFCLITCVITLSFLTVNKMPEIYNFNVLFALFLYSAMVFIAEIVISKANEVINLHMTLKEFEREKVMQSSFFKITHEIKNPIAVCKGYLDMIDVNDAKKCDKFVNIIKGEIDRTLTLLNDFQQFTKITIEREIFDLNLLLEDVKSAVTPLINKYKVNLAVNSEYDLEIYADYNRLKQVLINIIKNGMEANEGKKNGKIEVTAYVDNEKLYLIIKDNGTGMKKEIMEKLTVPFCTTKQTGSGLGVCLSNEIIKAHNGNLKYTSKVGVGTTAKIVLPLK